MDPKRAHNLNIIMGSKVKVRVQARITQSKILTKLDLGKARLGETKTWNRVNGKNMSVCPDKGFSVTSTSSHRNKASLRL